VVYKIIREMILESIETTIAVRVRGKGDAEETENDRNPINQNVKKALLNVRYGRTIRACN